MSSACAACSSCESLFDSKSSSNRLPNATHFVNDHPYFLAHSIALGNLWCNLSYSVGCSFSSSSACFFVSHVPSCPSSCPTCSLSSSTVASAAILPLAACSNSARSSCTCSASVCSSSLR